MRTKLHNRENSWTKITQLLCRGPKLHNHDTRGDQNRIIETWKTKITQLWYFEN